MTRRAKPVLHGRDHAPDGADPIPGLVLDGGGDTGGGDGFALTYGSGSMNTMTVAAGFSGYLAFSNLHSSGVTAASTGFTIETDGIYQVLAAGLAEVDAATPAVSGVLMLQVTLIINSAAAGYSGATSPVAVPSGKTWVAPLTVLDQVALVAGDTLRFQAVNATDVSAIFSTWRAVIQQLAAS